MSTTRFPFRGPFAAAALLLAIGACAPQQPPPSPPRAAAALQPEDEPDTVLVHVEPGRAYPAGMVETVELVRLRKVPCPGGTGESRTKMIGSQGDTLMLEAGHILQVPEGAVQTQTSFTLTDVDHARHLVVQASGPPGRRYQPRLILTISYQRCPETETAQKRLYMLRERLGWPGEDVGAEPVPDQPAVRANLDRLSRYVLASD